MGASPRRIAVPFHTSADADTTPGPVLLATMADTPFDPEAAVLAVELALEAATPLVVVDVADRPLGRAGHADFGEPPGITEGVVQLARANGAHVTSLRPRSPRPVRTLLGIVAAYAPAVVLFGADRGRMDRVRGMSAHRYRRVVRALESGSSCLLWTTAEPRLGAVPRARTLPR